eukprot:1372859-Alexandrium_andersonii.AAC.1
MLWRHLQHDSARVLRAVNEVINDRTWPVGVHETVGGWTAARERRSVAADETLYWDELAVLLGP